MEITEVYKASPIGDQKIPDLYLKAEKHCTEFPTLMLASDLYTSQGKLIADALFASLPGGTLDALLIEMLDRKRSLLRVRF